MRVNFIFNEPVDGEGESRDIELSLDPGAS